jgi:c-di-GMP-binding flagellar brake protein YcgR
MYALMGLIMYPLQVVRPEDFAFKKSTATNPNAVLYFVIGVAIVVLLLVILNNVRNKNEPKTGGKRTSGGGSSSSPGFFSGLTLHRLTSDLGLTREQVKMLDYVMKSGGITDPERFLNNHGLLDKNFKRTYKLIERTSANEEELNDRLAVLFSTRNIIDANSHNVKATSSRQIPEKVPVVLTLDKVNYPVQVISTRGDTLVVECPKRSAGSLLRPATGTKASLAFFSKSSKGYSIETRVVGTTDTAEGPALQLAHSAQLKRLTARHFPRRQVIIETGFFFVQVDSQTKKSITDKRRCSGKIMDISAGGCSIKTNVPINTGQKVKVEFVHNDNSVIAALGEVLRTNRTGLNTIMHIKFLKVPRRSLNKINAMVYEYAE